MSIERDTARLERARARRERLEAEAKLAHERECMIVVDQTVAPKDSEFVRLKGIVATLRHELWTNRILQSRKRTSISCMDRKKKRLRALIKELQGVEKKLAGQLKEQELALARRRQSLVEETMDAPPQEVPTTV